MPVESATTARPTTRWRAALGPGAVVLSVLVVHGVHVQKPLFYDDYDWYGASDHSGWVGDALSPSLTIYRPLVAFWFAGVRGVFGFSPVAYHVFALAFLIASALMVRVFVSRLGVDDLTATIAGVIYGAYGALTLLTIWASTAGGGFAVACALGAMVLLIDGLTPSRLVGAGLLFLAALLAREASVVAPALMTVALVVPKVGPSFDRDAIHTVVHKTAVLWVIAVTYFLVRYANGRPSSSGGYAAELIGGHIFRNARSLLQATSRFGVQFGTSAIVVWDVIFWATIVGAALLALRRGRVLPIMGLVWFAVACLPVLTLVHHAMDPYYLDFALVGLAITIASLLRIFVRSQAVVIGAVALFVVLQVAAVARFDDTSGVNQQIERSEALRKIALTAPIHDHTVTIRTHCARDPDIARHDELVRVVRNDPTLHTRFVLLTPNRC